MRNLDKAAQWSQRVGKYKTTANAKAKAITMYKTKTAKAHHYNFIHEDAMQADKRLKRDLDKAAQPALVDRRRALDLPLVYGRAATEHFRSRLKDMQDALFAPLRFYL